MSELKLERLVRIEAIVNRTERKVDALIAALAEDDAPERKPDLDGASVAIEREEGTPL